MLEQVEFHGGELDSAMYPPLRDSGDKHSPNSLFHEDLPASPIPSEGGDMEPAGLCAPPIPGLFFVPSLLLPLELADKITEFCLKHYFNRPGVNQIMLFGAASDSTPWSGLPPILLELLASMSVLLQPSLPPEIHALLFPRTPAHARQAILNLYHPGEGIIPHVDLLKRFGIVGLSLGSSCVMQFARVDEVDSTVCPKHIFLPERTMIVLPGDARYAWIHGIEKRTTDLVADADTFRIVERGVRLSITFRWLLPSEDVVGLEA
ncbi:hypothetical protein B0H16DRAFT_1503609 [Mycena metata]|uniref:Fe2OG dioxygenase domain-containing protein n=1 Tax=Mycena metata TaxID=1033252 RepID=A0AAD7NW71_9AGAR|nr:hypothetical protein B0H16DRAFT_1503609 [Mycena metata]